jgi:prevent-host-death family protein
MKTNTKNNSNIVGLKELRGNLERYISQVRKGRSFVVVRRSAPVFKIAPPLSTDEGVWEDVVDFTKIKKGGIALNELLARI